MKPGFSRISKRQSEAALWHWQVLFGKPPPAGEKRKPDVASGGPEGTKLRKSSSQDNTLLAADEQREAEARAAYIRFVLCPERHRLERLNAIIQIRSPEMISRMEQMRGLR